MNILSLGFVLPVAALSLLIGCASGSPAPQENDIGPRMSSANYERLIQKYTASDKQYDGFYNKLEVSATLLNSDVQTAVLQKTHETLQWDQQTAQRERDKLFQENSNSTKVFVSFFTPNRRINDFHKGTSVWKIYLESAGEKYEGKAMKKNLALEAIQALFPYHTRWAVAYDVTFPVPLSVIERNESALVITSTFATTRLKFKSLDR